MKIPPRQNGDSAGDIFPKWVEPIFACLYVCFVIILLICIDCYFGFFGGCLIKSYTRIWGTFEIGRMIIQVDSIGDLPHRVDLSLYPLGGGLLGGDSAEQVSCEALLLST